MKIAVFCSANSGLDAMYFKAAAELGRWMGENGHTLVFGGCNLGLMECIAEAVRRAEDMQRQGFYVRAVRPPTVPEGTARLRISLRADMTDGEMEQLIAYIKQMLHPRCNGVTSVL